MSPIIKNNQQWIWLALDKKTREIVGVYIGNRSEDGARGLWNSLPPVYRGAGDAPPPVNVLM
jgi:IS1 family transposase